MTFDRESYERQFELAKKRIPKGHIITHCVWRNGHLDCQSTPRSKTEAAAPIEASMRGVQAQLL